MFRKNLIASTTVFLALVLVFSQCRRPVLISTEEDVALGRQVAEEIKNNPQQYPMLDPDQHRDSYTYLNNMFQQILNSGKVEHRDDFPWQIRIIHDDEQLNAFAAPGGFIYVYTGLIKYLDKADDLAGVLGHEIAHSDKRHTSRQLERMYGVQLLLAIALGRDPGALAQIAAQIAGGLTGMAFSRAAEREADDYSVIYLAETPYACNGAYSFFQKLIEAEKAGQGPQFLSTHPNPENRVEDINEKAKELGCSTTPIGPANYEQFKKSLP
jgi:beta-barrel assembly-enhancing protease